MSQTLGKCGPLQFAFKNSYKLWFLHYLKLLSLLVSRKLDNWLCVHEKKKNHLQLPLELVTWIPLQLVLSVTSSLNAPYSTKWKYQITKRILLSFHLWSITSPKTLFPGSIPLSSVCECSYVWILLIALWDCRWLKKECSRKWDLPFDFSSIFSICCNTLIRTHTHTHAL